MGISSKETAMGNFPIGRFFFPIAIGKFPIGRFFFPMASGKILLAIATEEIAISSFD